MKSPKELIEELMINPILSHRPRSVPEEDYLAEIFCLNTRPIGRYRANVVISVVGNRVDGNKIFPEKRYVLKVNDRIIARMDDTRPDIAEIEHDRHGVIRVSIEQWDLLKIQLRKGKGEDEV